MSGVPKTIHPSVIRKEDSRTQPIAVLMATIYYCERIQNSFIMDKAAASSSFNINFKLDLLGLMFF